MFKGLALLLKIFFAEGSRANRIASLQGSARACWACMATPHMSKPLRVALARVYAQRVSKYLHGKRWMKATNLGKIKLQTNFRDRLIPESQQDRLNMHWSADHHIIHITQDLKGRRGNSCISAQCVETSNDLIHG